MATTSIESNLYKFHREGREFQVHRECKAEAARIDANEDSVLDDQEIMDYLIKTDALEDPTYHVVDQEKVVKEFKSHLLKEVPANALNYHTYDEVAAELARLAETHPDIAQRVSLGTSHEGREIWALKISSGAASDDTRQKPGVVITGCHHAREWMSMEAPLYVAQRLVEGYASDPAMKDRVDKAEIWVVPLVNPDGYEYSRTQDNWWRKNRRPVSNTFCDNQHPQAGMGVDLNRNYADDVPTHEWVYRPPGDTPCSTRDDFGRTSDNPDDDTYRGPFGASERETQAMLDLELGRGNIKGILDHHGYGQMILYPWGNTYDPVDNAAVYQDVGAKMNDALGDTRYRLMQSSSLYPTTGGSHDIHHINGIFSYTLEIGQSFQPDREQIDPIRQRVARANMVFLDEVIRRDDLFPKPPEQPPAGQSAPAQG